MHGQHGQGQPRADPARRLQQLEDVPLVLGGEPVQGHAAGEDGEHLEHLLVEHDDTAGLLERVAQVVVEVLGLFPALPGVQEFQLLVGGELREALGAAVAGRHRGVELGQAVEHALLLVLGPGFR